MNTTEYVFYCNKVREHVFEYAESYLYKINKNLKEWNSQRGETMHKVPVYSHFMY